MSRIETLDYDTMSPEQKKIADDIIASRGKVVGPFIPWLRNADLADRSQKLGAYCRYETSLPPRLSELAILILAREWTVQIEWNAHKPIALEAGTDPDLIDAIAQRETPSFKNKDEEVIYKFSTELLQNKKVSDETYSAAVEELSEPTVVDLVAILGYYSNVAMVLNTFEMLPADGVNPLAD
ncbi:MAG: carboxymuconolactone decarboxylase family protein [Rhodospirillaceae bacterium]|jgi:4-carboxymuconolactone decarboxylase|nr:carboxymuconolactone decarboxylase family protein [Rhodospirillaceae bacterium]MBT4589693.1 carboxymuconolactone decarboxylase family protein [Rhodospirillaceae bacterium]MBT7268059.1 carboxymuconolactone decarboxylase family protein [Rhodospirillaceae bacterium]